MLIVREVFTAKPGQASKLAKIFKKTFGTEPGVRVMTDFVGNYNTVVTEMQVKDLADFEKQYREYRAGKTGPKPDPAALEELSKYSDMYVSGRREVFEVFE